MKKLTSLLGIVRRLWDNAVHSTVDDSMKKSFDEVNQTLRDICAEQRAQREQLGTVLVRMDAMSARIDAMSVRIDALAERIEIVSNSLSARIDDVSTRMDGLSFRVDGLSSRIDELSAQQGRMVEEVASLKRDKTAAGDMLRRLARIEDRVFAHTG